MLFETVILYTISYDMSICWAKVKAKFTQVQAMKTHRGSRGIALLFL
jgi:hypothetical protein